MKLWVGRTEADIPDDVYETIIKRHPERRIQYTKLFVLYDKPCGKTLSDARIMCEVPSYRFPQIKEGEYIEFRSV